MVTPPPWLGRLERALKRGCSRGLGTVWVVAVSGGSDSVGLLRALVTLAPELGLRLSVAHLDHGVRGDAALADAALVAELASTFGLPFDRGQWQPTRSGHFEADARRARHAWLADVARARRADTVAVGHTRDDQAETILHRIVRGTGLRGLAGIPARRRLAEGLMLVRPLLHVGREEIRAYLAALGQPYREDASNTDLAQTRARIRHDLLPRLARDYNPQVADALVRLGDLAGAAERAREVSLTELARAVLVSRKPDQVILKRPVLERSPRYLRAEVLRAFWRRLGWPEAGMDRRRWRRLAALARETPMRVSLPGGIEAWSDDLFMVFRRVGPAPVQVAPTATEPRSAAPLGIPGTVPWGGGFIVAILDPSASCDERVDLDTLVPPLLVRAPADGDRFEPLGMDGRSTPLNDFFRGRGVWRDRRGEVPLVCDRRGIVWVAGHRIAHRVRRTEATTRTLGLRFDAGAIPNSCD
jgi:tRNA(Ile)-lysidine synthase